MIASSPFFFHPSYNFNNPHIIPQHGANHAILLHLVLVLCLITIKYLAGTVDNIFK